jgi:hypothetical protein
MYYDIDDCASSVHTSCRSCRCAACVRPFACPPSSPPSLLASYLCSLHSSASVTLLYFPLDLDRPRCLPPLFSLALRLRCISTPLNHPNIFPRNPSHAHTPARDPHKALGPDDRVHHGLLLAQPARRVLRVQPTVRELQSSGRSQCVEKEGHELRAREGAHILMPPYTTASAVVGDICVHTIIIHVH